MESFVAGPYVGALANTMTFLVMTHDDTGGQIVLEDGRARIVWPGVGREEIFKRVEANLESATAALGGTYVRNPMWSQLFQQDLVTVHPLGGCPMGDSAESGVVDHKGQVFDGAREGTVHDWHFAPAPAAIANHFLGELTMSLRINDTAPDFEAETTQGKIRFHEVDRRQLGDPVLAPEGLHARLHDRARLHGQDRARVHQAERQADRPVRRSGRPPQRVGQGHPRDAGVRGHTR